LFFAQQKLDCWTAHHVAMLFLIIIHTFLENNENKGGEAPQPITHATEDISTQPFLLTWFFLAMDKFCLY